MVHPCPYRKSNPRVLVVQAAENGPRLNEADGLNKPLDRRILVERQVGCVVVLHVVLPENAVRAGLAI